MRKSKRIIVTNPTKRRMGDTLTQIRDSIRLNQEEFGARINKSQQTVSRLEAKDEFTEEEYELVLKGLGVTREYFENFQGNPASFTVHHIQDNAQAAYFQNNYINPIEELLKAKEENKHLYERLLEAEKEKVAFLQRMLDNK